MMDYKEMAEIVTREVDAILERKKIRAMRIKKVSLAVSGLCAAVIVGVGAWRISSDIKKPDDSFNGSGIVSETETTTANAVTTAKVTTVTAYATETKPEKTTVKATTDTVTSEVSNNTAGTASSVSVTPVRTTASATEQVRTTAKTTAVNTSTSVTSSVTETTSATTTQKIPATMPLTDVHTVATTATYAVTTVSPTITTTVSPTITTTVSPTVTTTVNSMELPTTTYVIGYEDIDKQEISKTVAAKKSEYERSLLKTDLDAKEIEKLVTDYEQKLRIDMVREAYKEKAMEILEELGVDPETANFYNFTPNVSCPLTDEQYEKALNSPKVLRISIKQTG